MLITVVYLRWQSPLSCCVTKRKPCTDSCKQSLSIAGRQQNYIVIGREAMYEVDRLRPRIIVWVEKRDEESRVSENYYCHGYF